MTITVTASGISLDGPLVAGEVVAVSVSGVTFAEDAKPTLCLLGRFPDALLSSVELAEDAQTPGTWTGELDTATKQTAVFFATARADECRDAVLELVAARKSVARLMVAFRNSALCPSPFHAPDASPVYVPVPGPPGQGGDPYDQAPEMDGEASAGTTEKYARGDHRHPTDESRASTEDATLYAASFGDWVASGLPVGFHVGQTSWNAGNWSIEIVNSTGTPGSTTILVAGEETATTLSAPHTPLPTEPTTYADLTFSRSPSSYVLGTQADKPLAPTIPDLSAIRSGAAAGATAIQPSALATVATSGSYNDLTNKPTIPGPAPVTSVNGDTGDVAIYGNTLVMSSSDSTLVSEAINAAQSDATTALSDVSAKATATALAPAFSTSSTYAVGDYCTHEGLLYKCSTAVTTAGAWDASKWTAVAVVDEMGADTPLPFDAEVEYIENFECEFSQYSAGELDVEAEIYFADGYTGNGFAIGKWTNSKCFCIFMDSSKLVARYNNTQASAINKTTGEWKSVGIHGSVFFYGSTTAAITRAVFGDETSAVGLSVGTDVRIRSLKLNIIGGAPVLNLVPVRVGTTGCLYDKISGALYATKKSTDPTIGPDKAVPTITTPDRLVEIDERNNYLPYASTTTLAPETAVYRATATLSGTTATMPTVTITGIPTAAAYFAFELEVAVDATATALDDTAWSGWTWMDGGELPTADYAGKTLYIACRLDCTARTIKANCYEVA